MQRYQTQYLCKREYKNHKNGHGIEVYPCKICGNKMDDVPSRGIKKDKCNKCIRQAKRLRDRMRYHINKVNASKKNNKPVLSMENVL